MSGIAGAERREGVGLGAATERPRSRLHGVELRKGSEEPSPLPVAVVEPVVADAELLTQVVDYYHLRLKETPRALAYLDHRGLVHPEVVERFRLGFADRTRYRKCNRCVGPGGTVGCGSARGKAGGWWGEVEDVPTELGVSGWGCS